MSRRTPEHATTRQPVAISYIRFSTPEQADGDSLRRQTADTEAWCKKNGIPLDTSLTLKKDRGVSAFRGKHRDEKAALGIFLEDVKQGKIPRGSYLIIENLDRLSREEERTALRLWLDILDAGINIVQLTPETVFRHERSDMTDIIRAIIELSRGHSESRMKSKRCSDAWWEKVAQARANGTLVTHRLPAWIEVIDGRPQLIDERATVVRRMFTMAGSGYGCGAIVKTLVRENVAPFCAREKGDNGRQKIGEGCGRWNRMYVRSILMDRRALGEFQPKDRDGKPDGDPLAGYFPAVVTEDQFFAARAGITSRTQKQGRIGNGVACVFGGLLHDALDPKGGTYYAAARVTKIRKDPSQRRTRHTLVNSSYAAGRSACLSFPVDTFERALLTHLKELDPAEVLGTSESPNVSVVEGELSWLREKKASLEAELLNGNVAAIANALRQLEAREAELTAKLNDAKERAVKPLEETWSDVKTLADLMDAAPDKEDVRLRLRAGLRRIIEGVWIVVASRGRDRICEAQIFFRSGGFRSCVMIHRPSRSNGKGGTLPGRWWSNSIKQPQAARAGMPFNLEDLRDATQAEMVRGSLDYTTDLIDRLLESGQVID